jgi:hypothetical protein
LGGCWPLEADGTLRNVAREAHVQARWRPVLDAAVSTAHTALGRRLLGVYLRGSLPRGLAVEGVSDVDLVVFAMDDHPPRPRTTAADRTAALFSPATASSSSSFSSSAAALPSLDDAERTIHAFQDAAATRFPFCSKVEMRVVLVAPHSTLGVALQEHLLYSCDRLGDWLPPVLPVDLPHAFLLATQAVTLWGVDVPRLLPPAAAKPPPPRLAAAATHAEVTAARAAVVAAAGDDSQALRRRVLRWSLRRYLRVLGHCALAAKGEVRSASRMSPRCWELSAGRALLQRSRFVAAAAPSCASWCGRRAALPIMSITSTPPRWPAALRAAEGCGRGRGAGAGSELSTHATCTTALRPLLPRTLRWRRRCWTRWCWWWWASATMPVIWTAQAPLWTRSAPCARGCR